VTAAAGEAPQADADALKRAAAHAAVQLVQSGMTVGLGTGSTAVHAITELGRLLRNGTLADIRAVPTSLQTQEQAVAAGIPLIELGADGVDIAIDGCDEVDAELRAIKGLGGALTREKIVAASAGIFVLIADYSKQVEQLGLLTPVPVEVVPFGWQHTAQLLTGLAGSVTLRGEAEPVVTDNGNLILDVLLTAPFDPLTLDDSLKLLPGVVEHGLFVTEASVAFIADPAGVKRLERPEQHP
jgi:ribose 5-phosphate isomerase A